jgi:hypothetical protein
MQNLTDIDEVIEIEPNEEEEEEEEMEGTGTTLRHMFLQYLDKQGQPLFQSIEHTITGGTYHFILNKSKVEKVDTILSSIDGNLGKNVSGTNVTRTTDTSRQTPLQ